MVVISAVQRLAASRSRPQPQIGCSCGQDFDQRAAAGGCAPYRFLPVPILWYFPTSSYPLCALPVPTGRLPLRLPYWHVDRVAAAAAEISSGPKRLGCGWMPPDA